ncbi:MAG: MarR family transcriptional regulator [Betaproteobacteria bacterium]|nr:MAG: MarR family transcriptional regulator [Betaproteobacteria bacterium]TMH35188.1 MAG: MarR family transcriptional regulator [Betaproteobacteria bacterium]
MNLAFDHPTTDLESRVIDDHHAALKLWLRLLACTTRVEGVVRNRLRSEFATTLPRFDLLAQLEREPEGLTMGELSQRLMVTGGNITGITDQLEAEGLVKRAPHPSDRRAFAVQLTPTGRRQFRRMAAVHEQWVIELFAGWNADEKSQVYALLAGLKTHLASVDTTAVKRKSKEKT